MTEIFSATGQPDRSYQRPSLSEPHEWHMVRARGAIRRVVNAFSPTEQNRIITGTEESFTGKAGATRARLVGSLLYSTDSVYFASALTNTSTTIEEAAELLNHEGLSPLYTALFNTRQDNLMQIGLLSSIFPLAELPLEAQTMISPVKLKADIKIEPARDRWFLCQRTEPRITEVVGNDTIMVAGEPNNPSALVNVRGKPGILLLEDTLTSEGILMPAGAMYSPDSTARQPLVDAFDEGRGRVDISDGTWVFMRPVIPPQGMSMDTYLSQLKEQISHLPYQHPTTMINYQGMEMTRKDYRIMTAERR